MKTFYVIGLMSGTSLDGVDLVYIRFNKNEEWNFDIINSKTYPYEDSVIKLLTNISKKSLDEIKKIDIEYSKKLAILFVNLLMNFPSIKLILLVLMDTLQFMILLIHLHIKLEIYLFYLSKLIIM